MQIIIARHSGFCFGVKRAVKLTRECLKKRGRKNVYSLGPLIHNKYVVSDLSKEGLKVRKNLGGIKKSYCIIPSHGIDASRLKTQKGVIFIDATCPFVFKAQELVKKLASSGYEILILGDKNHPEVKGLIGISSGKAKVVEGGKSISEALFLGKKVAFLSQTTQSPRNFSTTASELLNKGFHELRIFNTICKDVIKRQIEAEKIARKADLVLVIGGKNSANTKRLAEISGDFAKTYHVDSEMEIEKGWFRDVKIIGIITGASTPGEFIGKVKKKIKRIKGGRR